MAVEHKLSGYQPFSFVPQLLTLTHLNLTSSSPTQRHTQTHTRKALIKSANEYSYPGHADPSAYAAIHLGVQMKSDLAASQSARSRTLRMRGGLAA